METIIWSNEGGICNYFLLWIECGREIWQHWYVIGYCVAVDYRAMELIVMRYYATVVFDAMELITEGILIGNGDIGMRN